MRGYAAQGGDSCGLGREVGLDVLEQGVAVAGIKASGYRGMTYGCSHECLLTREGPRRLKPLKVERLNAAREALLRPEPAPPKTCLPKTCSTQNLLPPKPAPPKTCSTQ